MQSASWTWLALLACVAAAGRVEAQPDLPLDAAEEPAQLPGAEGTEGVEIPSGEWVVPPVGVAGSIAYDFRASHDGITSVSHLVTGNLSARTFIYEPWFATVGGTLSVTSDTTRNGFMDGSTLSLQERVKTREQFLTGNARVDVFPASRFPFEAHVERTDSRIDTGLATNLDFRTSNIGFSQRYRPLTGRVDLTGSYDHREQDSGGIKARQDTVGGDFGTHWTGNELNVGASYSRARGGTLADDSRFESLVTRHRYAPDTALSIDSTANWTRTEENRGFAATDLKELQLSSVGLWHRDRSPLTLTATARYLSLDEQLAGSTIASAGGTLGANYELNRNLRLTANAGFNTTRTGGNDAYSVNGSAGAVYQGDSLLFWGGRYDWFGSGTAGVAVNDGDRVERERQTSLNLQLGHSFMRNWGVGDASTLGFNVAQTLSSTDNESSLHRDVTTTQATDAQLGLGSTRVLLNTVSGTWQTGDSYRSAFARASYSDSNDFDHENRFQLFNFQLSGNFELDNRRSLGGDLTWQRTRERFEGAILAGAATLTARTSSNSSSGEIIYREQRPFGIARLRFISRLKLAQDVLKQPGILQSFPDRETKLWENRLDYSIGRIDTQLVLRFSEVDGRRLDSVMFRIQRSFGQ